MKTNSNSNSTGNSNNAYSEKKPSMVSVFLKSAGLYIKKNYRFLVLFFAGFLAISFVNFWKLSTTESVASFSIDDFEIGQISDRTIISDKDMAPDEINPVAILKGEKILKKGFPVTEESYDKLKKMASSPVYFDKRSFANSELYLFILSIAWYMLLVFIYSGSFRKNSHRLQIREFVLQVVFFILVYACASLFGKFHLFADNFSICILIPSGLAIVLLSILYGQLPAVIFSFVLSLGVLNATGWNLVPALYTLFTSLCSCAVVRKVERRIDMIFVSIMLALINMIFMIIMGVVFNESLGSLGFVYFGVALNGFLSGLLVLGLITPLEIVLNTASVFRLMDLSDLNNPFIKNMLVQASGTYQHSLMVAQLAENACREIGANSLIARVGAYYHDIGKIDQSEYFVENQHGENKHDEMNPSLSASVIRSHVKKGVEKARSLHLPQVIIDIIYEHHGNSIIRYFYFEACKEDPNANPADYSYTGNPPTTKESAVVMLADSVEAACRTLENKSIKSIEALITKIFNGKVEEKQLDYCNLTYSDIAKIKSSFVQLLGGYYHSRIRYPDQENEEKTEHADKAKAVSEKTAAVKTESSKTEKPKTKEKVKK